ncbi:MAG: response regulator transcription factor [Cyanobacteria bacterium]|nr:response regulator transcription factor [Cyanobacteriota bacterium]
MAKILIVEDDADLRRLIVTALKQEHVVETADNGSQASELLRFYSYDLVILDWSLPDKDGVDICREFRQRGGRVPVLMLTAKKEIEEKEEGLDSGADDYLTKPFVMRELRARLAALLRRSPHNKRIITYDDLSLDIERLVLTLSGEEVKLLRREVQVLEALMGSKEHFLSTSALLEKVWGDENASASGLISCIKRLRSKVDKEGQPSFIETVPKLGYRLRQ